MKRPLEFKVKISTHSSQGGRKYQEDAVTVVYQQKHNYATIFGCDIINDRDNHLCEHTLKEDLDFVFVGIFDGHGGKEAAEFARDNLLNAILSQREFWSDDDELIQKAIKQGFINTHYAMLKEIEKWPKTAAGLPSTAGTTASVCFIMNGKYYTGHVGDSKIVLGKKHRETGMWIAKSLTVDHKPESPLERKRIYNDGGEVINKSGVERVVWVRPKASHKGPIRRSTSFEKVPFLAVARSLGDLWSYNPYKQKYVVSPEPDVEVIPIDTIEDKCLLLASDGLWNVIAEYESIRLVQEIQEPYEVDRDLLELLYDPINDPNTRLPDDLDNPSQVLVEFALQRWHSNRLRADNVTVLTVLLDPQDPPSEQGNKPRFTLHDKLSDEEDLQLSLHVSASQLYFD